jgi:GNAT superfamily N-acetyltransferase
VLRCLSVGALSCAERRLDVTGHFGAEVVNVRAAEEAEIGYLSRLWFDGWRDAHVRLLPPELARHRTLESFEERLRAAIATARVIGPIGAPVGLCMLRDDELYQLYVAAQARGTGIAARLVADAEARLSASGVRAAWLACAIGNERAARFYEKCGWHRSGTMINRLETPAGVFPLEVWRYEKSLTG